MYFLTSTAMFRVINKMFLKIFLSYSWNTKPIRIPVSFFSNALTSKPRIQNYALFKQIVVGFELKILFQPLRKRLSERCLPYTVSPWKNTYHGRFLPKVNCHPHLPENYSPRKNILENLTLLPTKIFYDCADPCC